METIWNSNLFKTKQDYITDYELYAFRKINEYLKQKTYRSPGSGTRYGHTVIMGIYLRDFEIIFREHKLLINCAISFKENYNNHRKILQKSVLEFLAKQLGVKSIFLTKDQI